MDLRSWSWAFTGKRSAVAAVAVVAALFVVAAGVMLSGPGATPVQANDGAPTVVSVSVLSDPDRHQTYHGQDSILVSVVFSETITVTGYPQLTLNIGDNTRTAGYFSSISSGSNAVFFYRVQSDDSDSNGLSIDANSLALNSGTIQDGDGNDADLSHAALADQRLHKVDGIVPTVSSVTLTSTPSNGNTYVAAEVVTARVTFSETVKVTDAPQLTLSIGNSTRTASYISSSGATVDFTYTAQSGDDDSDGITIAANSLALNGGTIQDNPGNNANLAHTALAADSKQKVDAVAPTVSSVTLASTPASDEGYAAGEVVTARVTFSESVVVTGTPQLTLNVGGSNKTANYSASSSSGANVDFTYTVPAGDSDSDGISIAGSSLALSGGTIKDGVGHNATLSHTALAADSKQKVDGIAPTVSSVTLASTPTSNDTYYLGEVVTARVTFSETITVTGKPQLILSIGDNTRTANYSASSGSSVDFTYTTQSTDRDSDGISIAANSLALNSGTIKDDAGNNATLTHVALAADSKQKVDGVAPTVSSVTLASTPTSNDTYYLGEVVTARVTFSETVTVTGAPQLTLSIGDNTRTANYSSHSGSSVDFTYTTQSTDRDSNGISIAANSLALNSGTIQDSYGNKANLAHTAVAANSSHQVNGGAPVIWAIGVMSSPGSDETYTPGDTVLITVIFSETVKGTGSPELTVTMGDSTGTADFYAYSGSFVYFTYKVQSGDGDGENVSFAANSLALNGATIRDSDGNDAAIAHDTFPGVSFHRVDGTAPTVNSVSLASTPANGDAYGSGEVVTVRATFSEAVTVTGKPQFRVLFSSVSSNDPRYATYSASSGANVDFTYTVQSGDSDPDGIVIGNTNAIVLKGGAIRDSVGNDATLTNSVLAAQSKHKVDGVAPTVSKVQLTSTPASGDTYRKGEVVTARVTFSETVTVTGAPQLTLSIGDSTRTASYSSATSSEANVDFTYTVQSGDGDTDGISIAANSLALNGGTIKDNPGNNATLTHTALADDSKHKVDDLAPTVTAVAITSTPASGDTYVGGEVVTARITFSEPVTATLKPLVSLNFDLDSANRVRWAYYTDGSGANLDFAYTVRNGDRNSVGLQVGSISLHGGTITDSDGNHAQLSLAGLASPNAVDTAQSAHKVNGNLPGVLSVSLASTPANGDTYHAGEVVTARVTFTETVTVTGKPRFFLDFGTSSSDDYRAAHYSSSSGANVDFTYTVPAGVSDADGISIDWNSIRLDGGTIQDSDGNNAALRHVGIAAQSKQKVDGIAPTVSSVTLTSTPANGDTYVAGETITARVAFNDTVTVTGAPQLTLNLGSSTRTATYSSNSSSGANVDFTYTTQSGDNDSDGIAIAANSLALNSGTIQDGAGNNATLTHTAVAADSKQKVDAAAPTVSSVTLTSTPSNGSDTYIAGDTVTARVAFSDTVTVTGAPQLTLSIGDNSRTASYSSATSSGANVDFTYTVQSGDNDSDGISIAADSLALNGGTIQDDVSNNATLTHTALAAQPLQKVDGDTPGITEVSLSLNSGSDNTYGAGDIVTTFVVFNERVTVTGQPQLTLTIGDNTRTATYDSTAHPSSGAIVIFEYTVQSGDSDSDGISIAANSLTLNGGTIRHDGDNATLAHAAVAAQSVQKVDGIAPTISTVAWVSSPGDDNVYGTGDVVTARVTFSEAVTVTGAPQLSLSSGSNTRTATYSSGSGGTSLDFTYTAQSGDRGSDGFSIAANSLTLNGGTIKDNPGNNATLTHAAVGDQLGNSVAITSTRPAATPITSARSLRRGLLSTRRLR